MIEKNRILFEEINKKNFEKKPKIKKRAQNFLNFVFGIFLIIFCFIYLFVLIEVEKNLVLAEEWSSLLKNKGLSSNYKLDSICSDLKKNLSIFTENINCSNFLDFYVKLCKNNLLIQKICLIKEENDNLRKFFMKHLEFRWNN